MCISIINIIIIGLLHLCNIITFNITLVKCTLAMPHLVEGGSRKSINSKLSSETP